MKEGLSFIGHLEELRRRIIISLAWLGIASVLSLPFAPHLLTILKSPAEGLLPKLAFFNPQDALLIYMKIGFLCGLVISLPVILYQFWAFISPAVEEKFKRHVPHFVISSSLAFIAGGVFAYFIILPAALKFLLSFAQTDLEPVISANSYISFVVSIILCCAIVFEMPVMSFLLTKLGLINAKMMRKAFKYSIVVMLAIAAIITPTVDAFNMFLIALPMIILYELSIWVSVIAGR